MVEPRLTDGWHDGRGPLHPALVDPLRQCLGRPYERTFDSVGFNSYRDGKDSVAWHRDTMLVTGGDAQRPWEHTIPKVDRAGPRMSLAFRHGLDPRVYE